MQTVARDTLTALGGPELPQLTSRSLRLSHFSRPDLKETQRAEFFQSAFNKPARLEGLKNWYHWLDQGLQLPLEHRLVMRLESRMALHLSGGTMENAGLNLDRYGVPFLPGSGVKGVLRHALIQTLRNWHRQKAPACAQEAQLRTTYGDVVNLAAATLRLCGWTEMDWKTGRPQPEKPYSSDFGYAFEAAWEDLRLEVVDKLQQQLNLKLNTKGLPTQAYAGSVSVLPAYPVCEESPTEGKDLVLDVLTCHHGQYQLGQPAPQQNPIPVIFPTVAAGLRFCFAFQGKDSALIETARQALQLAMETNGIGAKTAAGYGWMVPDEAYTAQQEQQRQEAARRQAEQAAREAAETAQRQQEADAAAQKAEQQAEAERRRLENEERKRREEAEREAEIARLAQANPEQAHYLTASQWDKDTLAKHLRRFDQLAEHEQRALLRLFQEKNPKKQKQFLKDKAIKAQLQPHLND